MPLVSIITAAYAPSGDFLDETIAGVQAQQLPPGWALEWIVQEDGAQPVLGDRFAGLDNIRYAANGAHWGIAMTRNLALARAAGDLVQVLDSDDVLLPSALATLIPRFEDSPVHWAIGQADDLMPDGRRVAWDSALPYGRIAAGRVNDWAIKQGGNWPVHCAGLMMRTASLRAVGGWSAVPNDEDIAMFSALSEITDGWNEEAVTWLYRQHPNQTTRTDAWRARSAESRRLALQRIASVRQTKLTIPLNAGLELGHAAEEFQVLPAQKDPGH